MTTRSLSSTRVVLPGSGVDELRVLPATLTFEDGRISEIVEDPRTRAELKSGRDHLDVGARLITPAFVNAHTHLALGFARGLTVNASERANRVEELFFSLERRLTAEQVRAFARIGIYESLLAGVGFVWEHYYFADAIAQAMRELGLCGALAPTLQDLAGPGAEGWETALSLTTQIDGDATMARDGIVAALGPHASDTVSESLWAKVKATAERHDLPLHYHLAQSNEEVQRSFERHACSPFAWLRRNGIFELSQPQLLAHAIFADHDDLRMLDPIRQNLVWCPRSAAFFALPADPSHWHARGLNWLVASDAAASNDAMDPRLELFEVQRARLRGVEGGRTHRAFMHDASGGHAGSGEAVERLWGERASAWVASASWTSPASLLSRLWGRSAKLHPRVRVGELRAGALANLIVWDDEHPSFWPGREGSEALHALCFSVPGGGSAIHNLMTLGQWRGEAGNFANSLLKSAAYVDALREARARRDELLAT